MVIYIMIACVHVLHDGPYSYICLAGLIKRWVNFSCSHSIIYYERGSFRGGGASAGEVRSVNRAKTQRWAQVT